ncbi:RagB/SusD family nutrient uptake outer membrane protein [Pedobacter glucosidilyticus]|uniref:RagB/SusD family nutrient uptake outer membrane protein n=1 Tax=Pedobacter glucosidilyticus TaxID=1122941 RepID=UPI0026ECD50F|nr:RagB/SusD family nutrient uptake outer membrane protein [Pedobacter glucosidilyticus]
MKNILILMTGCLMLLSSCKEDFLTLTPPSALTEADFYKNTADISAAVSASYAALQSSNMYQDRFITLMETRGDNIEDQNPGGNAGRDYNIDRFLAQSDNIAISDAWRAIYAAIARCNNALANINVVTNPSLKAQHEGELRFLRALHYFNIVRLWGAAPLVLKPITAAEAKVLPRSPINDVYAAIEDDLTAAINLLPPSYTGVNVGRASAGAAKALLGKVYLTEKKYPQAVAILDDLVPPSTNPHQYRLLPNVADVFSVNNKMNAEIIFAVRYAKNIQGQGHGLAVYFNQPVLDPKLLAAYESTDTRRDLLNFQTINGNNRPVKKYFDTFDPTNSTLGNDYIILRYADVLLMYAEALNEVAYNPLITSDAFVYLNAVRSRASATTYTPVSLPNQAAFRDAVLKERRLELPLELHRWFDLVRTNTAINALQTSGLTPVTIQPFQFLYPVPQTEVNIINNPSIFPQNTGYN